MPYYETVFIARQDLTEAQVKDLTEQFSKIITDNGGKMHKTENWGLRMLAYRINKSRKGHYVLIEVDAPSDAVIELERVMRLNEDVIRSLTIRQNQLSDEPSIMVEKASDKDDNQKFKYSKEKKEEAA